MKKFNLILILVILLGVSACKKSIDTSAKEPNWDRAICERCVMQLNDRLHSAQIVNTKDGSRYYFDDIGCAFLWLDQHKSDLENNSIIYLTDGKSGEWIDSREAIFAKPFMTSMDYGIAVFKDKNDIQSDKTILSIDEAIAHFRNSK